jgi:hypothetical protein
MTAVTSAETIHALATLISQPPLPAPGDGIPGEEYGAIIKRELEWRVACFLLATWHLPLARVTPPVAPRGAVVVREGGTPRPPASLLPWR